MKTRSYLHLVLALILMSVLWSPLHAQHSSLQSVDIDKLSQVRGVEIVYISPMMLSMVPKASLSIDGNPALTGIIEHVTAMHIFSSTEPQAIREMARIFLPITKARGNFERLMYIKNAAEEVNFVGNMNGDRAKELYLVVSDTDEYTVMVFSGDFTRKQIERALAQEHRK